MGLLSKLPLHPKIQYAAILVIGRYASWTAAHAEYLDFQVQFVTRGFEDSEATSAAALAFKFLSECCGSLMVRYLDALHPFYTNIKGKLNKQVSLIVNSRIVESSLKLWPI